MHLNDTHTDEPLPYWVGSLLALALGIVLTLLFTTWKGEPTPESPSPNAKCSAEDEVLVSLEGDAYGMEDNSLHCIHIDNFDR